MDETPYIEDSETCHGGKHADGIVTKEIPHRGRGRVRLLNKERQPVGDELPAFGCMAAGKVGEIAPLHLHPCGSEWHVTELED